MYRISVLFYTETLPNGITTVEIMGEDRASCVQQIVDKINNLEETMGHRTLMCRILEEHSLLTSQKTA